MFFLAKFVRDKASKKLSDKFGKDEEKPFLEHLEDLRKTLFKMIITTLIVTIGTFVFNRQLLEMIQFPLFMADIPPKARELMTIGAVEGMMLAIKVSFYGGIILSFPLLTYFIGEFVLPGLKENEKKLILPSLAVGAGLFIVGICFSYFVVIPRAVEFFWGFSVSRGWAYELRAGYYISFAVQLILVFGVSFELPVVVMALVKLEILSHRVMRNTRSTAILIMVIVSAIITPTTDVFTLGMLAGPLIVLYEICIWLAWWLEKRRERAEERERQRALKVATPMREPEALTDSEGGEGDGDDDKTTSGSSTAALPLAGDKSDSPSYDDANEYKPEDLPTDDDGHEPDIDPDGEVSGGSEDQSHDQDHNYHAQDEYHSDPHHSDHGDDYWNDPYHHGHHDDHHDYYSGPTEELKRELREELTAQIKAELRAELLDELRKELIAKSGKAKRISIDPRRSRRPR